jgi:ribonuclease/clavin/mitogillin
LKINIVNVGYDSTNYYVIAGEKTALLVDVGFPGTLAKLQHECKRMGVELKGIQYLFCTHFHPDHAGLAEELKALGIRLIITDNQLAFIQDNRRASQSGVIAINPNHNVVVPLDESRDILTRIGLSGQFLSTPGHSDDSVTLVLDEGLAFTGDLGHPMLAGDDPENAIHQSWRKIRTLPVITVYPGHGPSYTLKQFFQNTAQ